MVTNEERVSLANLARGAALERFDDELQRVLNNIADPNTAEGMRELKLTVKIKPDASRSTGKVEIICSSKTQPAKPCATTIFIGQEGRQAIAFEHDPEQLRLPIAAPVALPTRNAAAGGDQ